MEEFYYLRYNNLNGRVILRKLENYEPERVLFYFEEITKIPRCSMHETRIADWLENFAKDKKLGYFRDENNNIIIKKPATKGYENAPVLIIQGHMDMVCEKIESSDIDFENDHINFSVEDGKIVAHETTLGADNGIAVAMALAILESDTIKHPALEILITSNEENGMTGAANLDGSLLKGKMLLNLDSEREGVACIACAGGRRDSLIFKKEFKKIEDKKYYELSVSGLKGGHSGQEIHKGLANSNKLLARALLSLRENIDLIDISGGAKPNAIPRYSKAIIAINESELVDIQKKIIILNRAYVKEFGFTDPDVRLNFEPTHDYQTAFTDELAERIVQTLIVLPNGVQSMSNDIEGLVGSSVNIGVIESNENEVIIHTSIRSALMSLKDEIGIRNNEIAKLVHAEYRVNSDYPAWEYSPQSYLRDLAQQTYKSLYNKDLELEAIHAGLECGIFKESIGDIDMLSIGPNMYGVHAPGETLEIDSTERVYNFVLALLEKIK